MSQKAEFHNLAKPDDGLLRELAAGVTTRIFAGQQAMLSVVTIAPNAEGVMHHHPEEQWGVLLEGSAVRFQGGEEIAVKQGDFWRTPGNVPHTMRAGPDGARVLDIFRPAAAGIQKGGEGVWERVRGRHPEVRAAQAASLEGWRATNPGPSPFEARPTASHLRVTVQGLSAPMHNRASNFSVGRLMKFLTALGQDVKITVKPTRKAVGEMEVVVS